MDATTIRSLGTTFLSLGTSIAKWTRSHVRKVAKWLGFSLLGLWNFALALVRWSYTVGLALITISLVIVTLAAYQFQTRITEIETKFQMRSEIEAKNAEAGASTKTGSADGGALTKVELATELRVLQANYRIFRRYADDRWAVYLEAERRVSDELRPALYAQIRMERRIACPWLKPLRELPVADRIPGVRQISLSNESATAADTPMPSFTPAGPGVVALTSAIEAHREYLNYEKLIS